MEKKVKIRQKIIKKSVVYILLTMVVQIAVAPILAYYFIFVLRGFLVCKSFDCAVVSNCY